MNQPLLIDLFCGSFGWSAGWLELGGRVVGFDVEHEAHHGPVPDGAQLVLQDVRTIDGTQFRDASLIVASSPCQEFSYRAMPWKRAKALGPPLLGMELFAQAERIQREAIAAAGHFIPMVQENVEDTSTEETGTEHTRHLTNQDEYDGVKGFPSSAVTPLGQNEMARRYSSKSSARKAASARIAKIPFALASHIARTYFPR